ncbi:MAG: crossover junction endodeoxyribonuclease RuvC [Acidimicrobiia bacterium]|jgi:crossover junction endodeoxyribonuclease RuvC
MFVLGIDPGLSVTGYGVVQVDGTAVRARAVGVIRTSPKLPVAERLAELYRDMADLIAEHHPDEAAIEQVFVNRNLQTATSVGRASGVLLLAAAEAGIPIHEYTPSAVKMALTGFGGAPKAQVGEVIAMRFRLDTVPAPADAADALAIALCHAQALPLRRAVKGAAS